MNERASKLGYSDLDLLYVDSVNIANGSSRFPFYRLVLAQKNSHPVFVNGSGLPFVSYTVIKVAPAKDDKNPNFVSIYFQDNNNRKNKFTIVIPTELLRSSYNTASKFRLPLFSLMGEDENSTAKTGQMVKFEDLKALIDLPPKKSMLFRKLSKDISKLISYNNSVLTDIDDDLFKEARIEVIDILLRISKGDKSALDSVLESEQVINSLYHINNKEVNLGPEDQKKVGFVEIAKSIFNRTDPIKIIHRLKTTTGESLEDSMKEIVGFENLLTSLGLTEDKFQSFMDKENIQSKVVVEKQMGFESQLKFLKAAIKPDTIPQSMNDLKQYIPSTVYKIDWNISLNDSYLSDNNISAGEVHTSRMIVTAIRLARMQELYETTQNKKANPFIYLVKSLGLTKDHPLWFAIDGLRLFCDKRPEVISQVISSPMGIIIDGVKEVRIADMLLHAFGHMFIRSGLEYNCVEKGFVNLPAIDQFLSLLETEIQNDDSAQELQGLPFIPKVSECVAILQTIDDLTRDMNKQEIGSMYSELPDALTLLGSILVMKNTDAVIDSSEWVTALKYYTVHKLEAELRH